MTALYFNAQAVKINLDRASQPTNHLKRYHLFKMIDKTEVINDNKVKIMLKQPFSAFINNLAHPAAAIISPKALAYYGKHIGFHPVGTGPYQFVTWNQTEFVKVKKFNNYWKFGLPKLDSITWRPVVDNNSRAAMLQTGEATFIFPVPYEQAKMLSENSKLNVAVEPSIQQRYISLNVTQKPFDNLKVRQALNYAINKEMLIKVAFSGYAVPAEGPVPSMIEFTTRYQPWPYNPSKARQLLKEAGYPNGFTSILWSSHNHSTAQKVLQYVQNQLAQVGVKVMITAMDAGQRAAKVESIGVQDTEVRMLYTGWSASTGEADWALSPLFLSQAAPPKQFNTAFYKNTHVDDDLSAALTTTNHTEKQKLYQDAQNRIWADAPWIFLTTERLLSAYNKQLSGFYVMPDVSFNFDNANLQ